MTFNLRKLQKFSIFRKYDIYFIVAFAAFLRFFRLGTQSLWHDEIKAFVYATKPSLTGLINSVFEKNSIPPLYHLLLRIWIHFGQSEWWQRSLSAFAGTVTVIVFYYFVKSFFNRKIAILSTFFLTISPFHLHYSQESGAYSIFLLFALASLLFFVYALHFNQKRYLIWFVIATTLACFTHSIAFQLVLLEVLLGAFFLVKNFSWSRLKLFFASLCIIALLTLPFYAWHIASLRDSMIARQSTSSGNPWIFEIGYSIYSFLVGYGWGPSLRELHYIESIKDIFIWVLAANLIFIAFTLILVNALRTLNFQRSKFCILFIWLLMPLIITLVVSHIMDAKYNVRYSMLAFPGILILIAIGILGFSKLSNQLIFLGFFTILSGYSIINQYFNERYFKENTRAAGNYLSKFVDKEDLVLVNAPYMEWDISYYYNGDANVIGFPTNQEVLDEEVSLAYELRALQTEKMAKLWLILSRCFHGDKNNLLKRFIDRQYELIETKEWAGVNLYVYDLEKQKNKSSQMISSSTNGLTKRNWFYRCKLKNK